MREKLSFYTKEIEYSYDPEELKRLKKEIDTDNKVPIILKTNLSIFLNEKLKEIQKQ